jgi:SPP1 family predicted phage head-tail adaptor
MFKNKFARPIDKGNPKDIGFLNRQVRFERISNDFDDIGGRNRSWSTYKTVFAMKRDNAGNVERLINEHTENIHLLNYTVRYDSQIDTTMRIIDISEDRAYRIRGIKNKSHANRYIDIEVDGNDWETP